MRRSLFYIMLAVCCCVGAQTFAQTSPTGAPSGASTRTGNGDESGRRERDVDAAQLRNGRYEFVVSGPASQATTAIETLTSAGAQVVRTRSLPALRRQMTVMDLKTLRLVRAQQLLATSAPQTYIDAQHFYRYAHGKPRMYAEDMLQLSSHNSCRLKGVRVGMIDGAVSRQHPALATAHVVLYSALEKNERADKSAHGTTVAALIAGEDAAGALRGASPGVTLYAAAAFSKEKRGAAADVERVAVSLEWLLQNNVKLINMSFAGPSNAALEDLMQAAADRGAVLIAAVGNRNSTKAFFPAAVETVIAVTAVDAAARRYKKANRGTYVEFSAPGVDLYAAKRKGGGYVSGTSFAAPLVTALAARAMAKGAKSSHDVRSALRKTVRDLGDAGRDSQFGWGLVQATGC